MPPTRGCWPSAMAKLAVATQEDGRHAIIPAVRRYSGRSLRPASRAYCRGQEGGIDGDLLHAEVQHVRKCEKRCKLATRDKDRPNAKIVPRL